MRIEIFIWAEGARPFEPEHTIETSKPVGRIALFKMVDALIIDGMPKNWTDYKRHLPEISSLILQGKFTVKEIGNRLGLGGEFPQRTITQNLLIRIIK